MEFTLTNTPLFRGVPQESMETLLQQLGAYQRDYEKGEYIYHAGDRVSHAGMVLSGGVMHEHHDIWGNKSILQRGAVGEIFAESYAGILDQPMLVSVIAAESTQVLFLNVEKILHVNTQEDGWHYQILRNILQILLRRNFELAQKIVHTTPKSIRGRLMSYFSEHVSSQGGNDITIEYNRQQLADYLGVDRSAMSAELSKMAREGLVTYHKNHFVLHYLPA